MKKLYRSTRDKKLLGLCGGVAELLNIDATLLRVLFIVAVIFSSGALILVYVLAGLVVPKEPTYRMDGYHDPYGQSYDNPYGRRPGSGSHGYYNPGHGPQSGPSQQWSGWQQPQQPPQQPRSGGAQQAPDLDSMMGDIEKKAMRKEIDELRAKLARYEKGDH
ncbi:PspC domain-containing protein [Paenibacillus sp. IB182496]|uniref:PspC domain-containing protein n=1 Tax=Paenibacillus sabuli TaxID=2772509 RepID=A0A927BUP3_9BACL|nr:PspC domain-containing protein [Paenibacillus sabuli]MBD2847166.1 PspC domain-containing protein [Paenibacillus sabuli]